MKSQFVKLFVHSNNFNFIYSTENKKKNIHKNQCIHSIDVHNTIRAYACASVTKKINIWE